MEVSLVLAGIGLVRDLMAWIQKAKQTAAQTDAWTPAERAQIDAEWANVATDPAWRTAEEEAAASKPTVRKAKKKS